MMVNGHGNCHGCNAHLTPGSSGALWGKPLGADGKRVWEDGGLWRAHRRRQQQEVIHSGQISQRWSHGPVRGNARLESHRQFKICSECHARTFVCLFFFLIVIWFFLQLIFLRFDFHANYCVMTFAVWNDLPWSLVTVRSHCWAARRWTDRVLLSWGRKCQRQTLQQANRYKCRLIFFGHKWEPFICLFVYLACILGFVTSSVAFFSQAHSVWSRTIRYGN